MSGCGKPVENLWKTCGNRLWKSPPESFPQEFSTGLGELSTGFPQLYPQVFHRTVSPLKVAAAVTIRVRYNVSEANEKEADRMLYKNFIGGQWVDSATGKTFKSLNPADTSDELGEFPSSDAQDVERAVQAADRAFREWSKVPAPKRGELLFEIGERLKRQKEDLAQIMTREMGKVTNEARGDVQEAIDMGVLYWGGRPAALRAYDAVGVAAQALPQYAPSPGSGGGHYAVELPHRDPSVEDLSGASRGKHSCLEARYGYPALRL
jgi:hypothetical protein